MTREKINQLISISSQKEKALGKFLDLSKEQTKSITLGEFTSLESILSTKSKIIEEVDKLDDDFLKVFDDIKNLESIKSMEEINGDKFDNLKNLKDITLKIKINLEEIYRVDQENTRIINKNIEEAKSDLRQVKDARTAYKGYNVEQGGSIMIDERK